MKLQLDPTTWLLFLLTVALWAASVKLAGERSDRAVLGWRIIPLSIFGFAWLGFGVDYIFRFLCLVYDVELFRVTLYPPGLLPAEVLSQTWLAAGVFWLALCLGYVSMLKLLGDSIPAWLTPFWQLNRLTSMAGVGLLDKIFVISTLLTPLVDSPYIPRALVTPLGLIASLCVIPITISWQLYFQGQLIGMRRFIYLLPVLILYYVSPYRSHLLLILICISLPALLFRQRLAFYKLFVGVILFLIFSTVITDTYRNMIWGSPDKYAEEGLGEQWEQWQKDPGESPWIKLAKRFHGFDSTAVTVNSVPSFFPYSNRNVFMESLTRAFLPRAIFDTKADVARGREFSVTIWALGERGVSKRASAMIAPSVTGDLYHAHGLPMIIVGGIFFGLVVGLLEKLRSLMGPESRCIMVAIFGLTVAVGLETDYALTLATIIQRFIILYVATLLISHVQFAPPVKIKKWAT